MGAPASLHNGNATYLRFPLCSLWSAFCTAEAWLSSYAGYQTPAHCIAQAWIAHMQPTKQVLYVLWKTDKGSNFQPTKIHLNLLYINIQQSHLMVINYKMLHIF
jgi:hypothetical protein